MMWKSALFLVLGTSLNSVHAVEHFGARTSFQTGRVNGDMYAGGLDFAHDMIFVTGGTKGSNGEDGLEKDMCFTSRFNMDQLNNHTQTLTGNIGNGTIKTICTSLSMMRNPTHYLSPMEDKPFVVVGTEWHPPDEGTTKENITRSRPTAFAMSELPWEAKADGKTPLMHGNSGNGIAYPQKVVYVHGSEVDGNNGSDDGIAILASVSSKKPHIKEEVAMFYESKNVPKLRNEMHLNSQFELTLQKLQTKFYPATDDRRGHNNMTFVKQASFEVDTVTLNNGNETRPDAMVTGMILTAKGDIVVTGYTAGSGAAYGAGTDKDNLDGFVTVLNKDFELRGNNPVSRFASEKEDYIFGVCDDKKNPEYFYVVGATANAKLAGERIDHKSVHTAEDLPDDFDTSSVHHLNGFVQKRRLDTLEPVWGKFWPALKTTNIHSRAVTAGIDCHHLKDGTLYVAGIVENGAHAVKFRNKTHNFDDLLAISLDGETGSTNWITQFGSEDGYEKLAKNGAIAIDKHENAIIYGDTTGSMFRERDDTTDTKSNIFLATLLKTNGVHEIGKFVKVKHDAKGQLSGNAWKDEEVQGHKDKFSTNFVASQSGPTKGSAFAAGLIYDTATDQAFTTGILDNTSNKKSTCMLNKLDLTPGKFDGFSGAEGKLIGGENHHEVCSSLAFHGNDVVIIGGSETGSKLSKDKGSGPWAGFATSFDRNTFDEKNAHIFEHAANEPLYPTEIVVDGNDVFVLSLQSKDTTTRDEFNEAMNSNTSPNWLNIPEYGAAFDMSLVKVGKDGSSSSQAWFHKTPVDVFDSKNGMGVSLGGVIVKNGYVLISGSTRSTGAAFGKDDGKASGDYDDAFFAIYDKTTGDLVNGERVETPGDDFVLGMCHDPNDSSSFYVVGGSSAKAHSQANPSDPEKTQKAAALKDALSGSIHAFVLKVSTDLKVQWKHVIGSVHRNNGDKGENTTPTTIKALDCAVKGDTVFVAGDVYNDAQVVSAGNAAHNSRGGDDIWFGSFKTDSGDQNWIGQAGSDKDDHLAPRGGAVVRNNGSLLLHGDTKGEFFRFHDDPSQTTSELFLMEIGPDGHHQPHINHDFHLKQQAASDGANNAVTPGNTGNGHNGHNNAHPDRGNGHSNYPHAAPHVAPTAPVPAPHEAPQPAPVPAPVQAPVSSPTVPEVVKTAAPHLVDEDLAGQQAQAALKSDGLSTAVVIIISIVGTVVFVIILFMLFCFYRRKTTGKEKTLTDGIVTSETAPPNSSFRDDPMGSDTYNDDPAENLQLDGDKNIV